jgi:transcriptional regulator
MRLTRVETNPKLSEPHLEDRIRVIARLEGSDSDDAQATARWMRRVAPP